MRRRSTRAEGDAFELSLRVVAVCALSLGTACARSHVRTQEVRRDPGGSDAHDSSTQGDSGKTPDAQAGGHQAGGDAAPKPGKDAALAGGGPRLVVGVVIDQLGSNTLLRLERLLAKDGALAHARSAGVVYEQVVYPYAATLTAPGHAAIYSGAVPAETGVTANYAVDQTTRERHAAEDDATHPVIGSGGFAGPGILHVDTVSDSLKAATAGAGRVVSLSLKARSAVLPGGKHPDAVLWYSAGVRGFTTSTYYATQRPSWVVDFEAAHPIVAETVVWEAHDPRRLERLLGRDDAPGERDESGLGTMFPHRLADTSEPYDLWTFLPDAAEYLLDLAVAAVDQYELGKDETPDLLAISISSTDYTGHVFGPHSWEYADHLRRVDRALLRMSQRLAEDTSVAVLITSDHGVADTPEHGKTEHADAMRLDGSVLSKAVEQAIEDEIGGSDWVVGYDVPYMLLSSAAHAHPEYARIRGIAIEALRAQDGVQAAFDAVDTSALRAAEGDLEQAVLNSIHPDSSGDIFVVVSEYVVPTGSGTTHGSPWAYDSHVPVLLWGPGIAPARHEQDIDQRSVGPTLAALLRVPAPSHAKHPPLPGAAP